MRLVKLVGLGVVVLAAVAGVVALGRVAQAQTQRERPFLDLYHLAGGGSQLGVSVRDVDEADVKREKLPAAAGAAVEDVRSGSPAEKAGVKAGDVIVAFDGEKVRSARHLTRLVEETPDGRQVEAIIVRNGERVSLKLTPEPAGPLWAWRQFNERMPGYTLRMPERFDLNIPDLREFRGDAYRPFRLLESSRGRLGVGVQELTGQLGEYFGVSAGLLVTDVDEGTPAKAAGLRAGDVITKVNDQQVRNADELRRRLADATDEVRITIVRDKKEQTVTAKLDQVEASTPRRVIRRLV